MQYPLNRTEKYFTVLSKWLVFLSIIIKTICVKSARFMPIFAPVCVQYLRNKQKKVAIKKKKKELERPSKTMYNIVKHNSLFPPPLSLSLYLCLCVAFARLAGTWLLNLVAVVGHSFSFYCSLFFRPFFLSVSLVLFLSHSTYRLLPALNASMFPMALFVFYLVGLDGWQISLHIITAAYTHNTLKYSHRWAVISQNFHMYAFWGIQCTNAKVCYAIRKARGKIKYNIIYTNGGKTSRTTSYHKMLPIRPTARA